MATWAAGREPEVVAMARATQPLPAAGAVVRAEAAVVEAMARVTHPCPAATVAVKAAVERARVMAVREMEVVETAPVAEEEAMVPCLAVREMAVAVYSEAAPAMEAAARLNTTAPRR